MTCPSSNRTPLGYEYWQHAKRSAPAPYESKQNLQNITRWSAYIVGCIILRHLFPPCACLALLQLQHVLLACAAQLDHVLLACAVQFCPALRSCIRQHLPYYQFNLTLKNRQLLHWVVLWPSIVHPCTGHSQRISSLAHLQWFLEQAACAILIITTCIPSSFHTWQRPMHFTVTEGCINERLQWFYTLVQTVDSTNGNSLPHVDDEQKTLSTWLVISLQHWHSQKVWQRIHMQLQAMNSHANACLTDALLLMSGCKKCIIRLFAFWCSSSLAIAFHRAWSMWGAPSPKVSAWV